MSASTDPAAAAMLNELHAAGIETAGFGSFSKSANWFDHGAAVPILLRWLPEIQDVHVRESIVRSLTGEPAAESHAAGGALAIEFRRSLGHTNLGWATANALATLAEPSDADAVIELLRDRRFGTSRQMLCEALKRTRDTRTPTVLVELIEDDDVAGHAIAVLRSLRDPLAASALADARDRLEDLAERPTATPFARKQAHQALDKIDAA